MVKDQIKYTAGLALAKLLPQKADDIRNGFTIPDYWGNDQSGNIFDRLIRFYTGCDATAAERKHPGQLETLHKNFWCNVDRYFSEANNRADNVYVPAYQDIVQRLKPLLINKNIQQVCEFGSGDGRWLNYLSQQWAFIKNFTGVDISKRQVEANHRTYQHLRFVRADLVQWIEANVTDDTLYHTNGGVLEYLCENSVKRLIKILKTQAKNPMLLFIEPLHGDYDLHKDLTSKIIGYEHSYTHNYVHLLTEAGMGVISHEERTVMGYRMLIVLAHNVG